MQANSPVSIVANEDCMIGMSRYPDKFFDLAIVDPPYGISVNMNMGRRKGKKKKHTDKDWDNDAPSVEYFLELQRVSKNQIVWGANHFISRMPNNSSCWLVWDKGETMYGRDFAEVELAYTSFDKSARIRKINPNQLDRVHPTQKPIELYRWMITKYANEGDKILDTHMGSQSSRIAAHIMGFDYWGWEIDAEYFDKGNKRFNLVTSQQQLF